MAYPASAFPEALRSIIFVNGTFRGLNTPVWKDWTVSCKLLTNKLKRYTAHLIKAAVKVKVL